MAELGMSAAAGGVFSGLGRAWQLRGNPCRCFTADTPVQMADGSVKAIASVQPGDWVKSRNEATGRDEARQVTASIKRLASATVTVSLADSKTGKIETLTCTPEHPLFVQGQGWVEAGSVGIGTSIVSRAGPALEVTSLTWEKNRAEELAAGTGSSFGGYTVYNLTVEDDHTFFVGAANGGIWVHNMPCAPENNFPGVHQGKQVHHDPTSSQWRPLDPRSGKPTTLFDPRELPAGKTVDQALEDAWNNPIAGTPATGQLFGKPGYPLNAAGDMYLEMRVSGRGVHGWPTSVIR